MTDYTSLDVSKRLAEAGFKGTADGWHVTIYVDGIHATSRYSYYRSDTLLSWLLEHGQCVVTAKINGRYAVKRYKAMKQGVVIHGIEYPQEFPSFEEATLSDALGEVILAVMAKEARRDNG